MRTARRLSIVALTILFATVALVAGERAIAVVIAPNSGNAAPLSPRETSIVPQPALSSHGPPPPIGGAQSGPNMKKPSPGCSCS